jgi:hypothetical protein
MTKNITSKREKSGRSSVTEDNSTAIPEDKFDVYQEECHYQPITPCLIPLTLFGPCDD